MNKSSILKEIYTVTLVLIKGNEQTILLLAESWNDWDALHPACVPSNLKICSLSSIKIYFPFCVNLDRGNRVQFCSSFFLHSIPTFSGSYTHKREQKIVAFRRSNCNHLPWQFQKVILLMLEKQGFLNSIYEILFSEDKFFFWVIEVYRRSQSHLLHHC